MDMAIRFPNLGVDLDYVGKSIHIFGFEITIYGILIAVGMFLGIGLIVLEAKRKGCDQDRYLDMLIISLIAAVVGARLFYVAFSWELYRGNPLEILNTRNGGTAFYGGLLGGVLGAAAFCRIKKLSFGQMADASSVGILLGQAIGRWGDFFSRESFGEYTDNLFAMQLPLSAVHASDVTSAMRDHLETIDGISYIQVQPAFLYESLWCLLVLVFLLFRRSRKRFEGEIFMNYLAGYGLGRFFIEGIRTDSLNWPGTRIAVSQVVSALLFVFFTIAVLIRRTMVKKREEIQKRRRESLYQAQEETPPEEEEWSVPLREPEEQAAPVEEETSQEQAAPAEEEISQEQAAPAEEEISQEQAAPVEEETPKEQDIPEEEIPQEQEVLEDLPKNAE